MPVEVLASLEAQSDVEEYKRDAAAAWLVGVLPQPLVDFLVAGRWGTALAVRQVPDPEERRAGLKLAFLYKAGPDGAGLGKARRALEELVLFSPEDHLPASAILLNRLIAHVDAKARAKKRGSQGGSSVAALVRTGLILLALLGFPIDARHLSVDAAAPPARKRRRERRAGSFPIKLYCHFEAVAASSAASPAVLLARSLTVLVWSDARWEASDERPAGLGFVVFFPASREAAAAAASSRSPPWMGGGSTPPGEWRFAAYEPEASEYAHWRERSQYIGQLELLAAVTVYYSLARDLRGRRVLHFIDNSGAMASLVKDYSRDLDSAKLVHTFWAIAAALDIEVWFVFVYSEANIADWPSRGSLAFADDLAATRVEGDELRLPPSEEWGSVAHALSVAGVGTASSLRRKRRRGS